MPNLEVIEVVLVQCNLEDNQYQQKLCIYYTIRQLGIIQFYPQKILCLFIKC